MSRTAKTKKRREDERKRQEKRRRERNKRTTDSSSGSAASGGRTSGSRTSSGSSSDKSKDKDKVAGMETKYFKGCVTLDDLSLRYKKLCLIYHPDSGSGDVDTYIELKDEYELLKKRLS